MAAPFIPQTVCGYSRGTCIVDTPTYPHTHIHTRSGDSRHCLGCSVVQVICSDDVDVAGAQDGLACIHIGSLQAHNLKKGIVT